MFYLFVICFYVSEQTRTKVIFNVWMFQRSVMFYLEMEVGSDIFRLRFHLSTITSYNSTKLSQKTTKKVIRLWFGILRVIKYKNLPFPWNPRLHSQVKLPAVSLQVAS